MAAVYVLVHGAARGGWIWDKVVPLLEERQLQPFAPDLPGHGSSTASRAGVNMTSYADYLESYILDRDLTGIVLVGHSMAGVVISKVAERLPNRIDHLIYVAGMVLKDGEAVIDYLPEERIRLYEKLAAQSEDNSVTYGPDITASYFADAPPDDRAWALSKLTPQPFGAFTERVTCPSFYMLPIPRTYVACTYDQSISRSQSEEFARRLGVDSVELPTGHDPMISQPARLAEVLDISS